VTFPHQPAYVPTLIGEGFEGSGNSAAHVKVVLGDRNGPVGAAWTTALATPSVGHAPFLVVARPGLPVKPLTLFVNTATITGDDHATLTWGAAQAGVAAGVIEAVRQGRIPVPFAEAGLLIASVWVDPGAGLAHQDAINTNNRVATVAALEAMATGSPTVDEVMSDQEGIWNAHYTP
jgi:5,6,7,8-tetrahydromethanopterin hydro-lyase